MEKDNKKFNLSNLVTTGLLTGLLAIGAAHYMENKKRTEVEENLLAVVNDLVIWHKQRTELADENTKVVKYLSGFHGMNPRAAELGILFADKEFRERIQNDSKLRSGLVIAMRFGKDNNIELAQQLEEQINKSKEQKEEK
jgi:hypothetical protein